jgi:serine protease DegS
VPKRVAATILFIVQFALVGLGIALLVLLFGDNDAIGLATPARSASYAAAVARAAPTVVSIHTATAVTSAPNPLLDDPLFQKFFRIPGAPRGPDLETSLGSGVIVHANGYILTNYHVVRDADRIQVAMVDGHIADAVVVGTDPGTDIAVLHIDHDGLQNIAIGDSNQVRVGDIVLAIGNPLGVGQTVTQGIVSATGRDRVGINTFENFIQTDAAINPGNSGGALINAQGELIGINSAILGYQGISFAIPTSIAVDIMQQLIEAGTVERGWIGVEGRDLSARLRAELDAKSPFGIVVLAVLAGGPADMAGIRPGDIITHIAGHAVGDSQEAIRQISSLKPGTMVRIRGTRRGRDIDLHTSVAKRPSRVSD